MSTLKYSLFAFITILIALEVSASDIFKIFPVAPVKLPAFSKSGFIKDKLNVDNFILGDVTSVTPQKMFYSKLFWAGIEGHVNFIPGMFDTGLAALSSEENHNTSVVMRVTLDKTKYYMLDCSVIVPMVVVGGPHGSNYETPREFELRFDVGTLSTKKIVEIPADNHLLDIIKIPNSASQNMATILLSKTDNHPWHWYGCELTKINQ